MNIETSYEKAGYCLEYLQSLRSSLDKKANELGLDIRWMIDRLCTFSCESDFSKSNKDYATNENWLKLLSVYQNLLQRGIPTYPTAQIEEFLVSEATKVFPFEKSNDEATIAFRDKLTGALREKWLEFLVRAHATIDYRCNKLQGVQDSDEEKAFLNYASEKVGPSVFQLMECQRRLDTMTETSELNEVYEQRVDFSLETKDTKKVIEIDGEQHIEEKQLRLDKQREAVLRKNNWGILRIPAWKVRRKEIDEVLEDINKAFSEDPFLRVSKESFDQPINSEQYGRTALLLVLTPIAVARIQWALNWAFMKGKLDLNQKRIKIAIVEEDIPCAFIAVLDFIKSLNHLATLAKIESPLPEIELEIIRSYDFDSFSDGTHSVSNDPCFRVNISRIDKIGDILQNHFDLVIAISSLHVGTRSPRFGFGHNNWVAINSVFTNRGVCPRYKSEAPINYNVREDNPEELQFFLQWIFRKKTFLDGQLRILERSLANRDVIGLLPTGGGKSLCYQLSALLQPGMTLIIDPLISLMHDQIENLKQLQIDAIAYLSGEQKREEKEEVTARMEKGFLLLLFITPERLQSLAFRQSLGNMCLHTSVPYLVIDEAHCVSEWGHDFRPSYLRLAETARKICLYRERKPTVIGLTGTASWVVLSDMQREIEINEDEAVITPKTFDRKELEFNVEKCTSKEKMDKIVAKILELPQRFRISTASFFTNENAGIVFCPHTSEAHGVSAVANRIHQDLPDLIPTVKIYSGKSPKGQDWQQWKYIKAENQKAFKNNQAQLMVATKAFGMGIDKPNIRFTIHYNIPTSLEAFYQEAGRAGRDRKPAVCIIIFSGETSFWNKINITDITVERLKEIREEKFSYSTEDDISRMLFLHEISWQGIETELQSLLKLINEEVTPRIKNLEYGEKTAFSLRFSSETNNDDGSPKNEKALYRLSVLGLISDYTKDYRARQFDIEVVNLSDESIKSALLDYFARYKPVEYREIASQRIELSKGQTVLEKCLRVMLEFVYEEIEKKRRRAIFQMAEVADTSVDDAPFRRQLLDYLEKSEFTKQLMETAKKNDPMEWVEIALKVEDIDSARHLLGGCRRALESYPDHPGLLLLSSFSRTIIPKLPTDMAIGEFQRAVRLLAKQPEKEETRKALVSFLEMVKQKRPILVGNFCYIVLEGFPQRDIARTVLKYADTTSQSGILALRILLENTLEKTRLARAHILGGEPN